MTKIVDRNLLNTFSFLTAV